MCTNMPAGRPTDYNVQIADEICERLSEGESLRSICREDKMPCKATVFRWLVHNKQFADQYDRSRQEQAELLADEIVDIADESTNDKYIDDNGNERTNNEAIARSRLRVDARKWVASKLKPKKYGDKTTTEIGGIDGAPILSNMTVTFVTPKNDD